MKERIKGAFTKKKIFHFLKMALFVVALSLILLSLLGTVAHATGLVDDTINAENLYSKYPLSNYQLDFYVDNSWSWLPWNWLDGIGKSVQYGLYCITNFVWTISLYLSNATGYVVQEAYKLDFINDMADSIGKSIQTLAGVTENGFSSTGFYVGFRAPEGELTLDTLRITKKYGMHYSSNLCDDDRPYQKDLENGETLLEIPIHWDNYDLPYFAFNYHPAFPKGQGRIANYTGVINNWKDEFYGCYEYGLCYVLQLDPAAIGAPGRIGLLEELLDYIDEFDSVWWTSGEEMYQYYQNK